MAAIEITGAPAQMLRRLLRQPGLRADALLAVADAFDEAANGPEGVPDVAVWRSTAALCRSLAPLYVEPAQQAPGQLAREVAADQLVLGWPDLQSRDLQSIDRMHLSASGLALFRLIGGAILRRDGLSAPLGATR